MNTPVDVQLAQRPPPRLTWMQEPLILLFILRKPILDLIEHDDDRRKPDPDDIRLSEPEG